MSIKSAEEFHHKINTFFHAMLSLPLAVFIYLFMEYKHNDMTPLLSAIPRVINYIVVLITTLLVYWAWRKFNEALISLQDRSPLSIQFEKYLKISKRFYLMVGIACVLVVGSYYLTQGSAFIVIYVLILFLLSLNRPTYSKFIRDLKLEGADKEIVLSRQPFASDTIE